MANHKSSLKRIRQNIVRRLANRYYKKTTRSAIMKLRGTSEKSAAEKYLPKLVSMIDRLTRKTPGIKTKLQILKVA